MEGSNLRRAAKVDGANITRDLYMISDITDFALVNRLKLIAICTRVSNYLTSETH